MTSIQPGAATRRISPRAIGGAIVLALLLGMALSTTYVSASAPVPGAKKKFDAASYGKDSYRDTVKPAIESDPVDLVELAPLLQQDAEAAGERYGTRQGSSPYTYSVSLTGTAEKLEGALLRVSVPGLPRSTTVSVQVGPAINGTALRDANGLITFNDFVNQVDYADVATALNNEMKNDLLSDLDPKSLVGKQITVVGAAAPLNPDLVTLTPVSIEVAS